MAADRHHVIIGNGVAGVRAATVLRERDPDNRITIISIGGLLFSVVTAPFLWAIRAESRAIRKEIELARAEARIAG